MYDQAVGGFITGIKDGFSDIGQGVLNTITHPIKTLKSNISESIEHTLHPIKTAKESIAAIKKLWNSDINTFSYEMGKIATKTVVAGAIYEAVGTYNNSKIKNKSTKYYPGSQNQPLPENIAKTFSGGTYTESILTKDTTFYRVWSSEENKIGRFMTRVPQNGGMQSQIDLALNPEWKNYATYVEKVVVPKGTTIYEGKAASQVINGNTGELLGGVNQVFIKEVKDEWFK